MATRKWERLSEEEKNSAKEAFISFYNAEMDEPIGVIGAEKMINFFLQTVGTTIYNAGIKDAKQAIESRQSELLYDLDDLMDY